MSETLLVRSTVNLPGLRLGQQAFVDPEDPYIKTCLEGQLVVPVGEPHASVTEELPEELPDAAGTAGSLEAPGGEAVLLDGESAVVEHFGSAEGSDEAVSDP